MTLVLRHPLQSQVVRPKRSVRVTTDSPRLSVVIVNYHQWNNTAALVGQLRASATMRRRTSEVMVVDNHSPRHPIAKKLRRSNGVSLRRWGRNRGFARAVNEGCRLSEGDWFLLLNPDMRLPDHYLDEVQDLTEHLSRSSPRAGIVGLGLDNDDGAPQPSTGSFPTLWNTLGRLCLPRSRRKYDPPADVRGEVDWVTGCGMLIRRDCWRDLQGFDTDYFLYYEDVDLCLRAHQLGWSVLYEPSIRGVHFSPVHRRRVSPALRLVMRHSLLTYAGKHWPRWQVRALARIIQTEASWRRWRAERRGETEAARLFRQTADLVESIRRDRQQSGVTCVRSLAKNCNFYERIGS